MELSRRDFVKGIVGLGAASVFLGSYTETLDMMINPRFIEVKPDPSKAKFVHSACLGCNVRCGIRVKVVESNGMRIVERISGNPYHVYNRFVSTEKQSKRYEPINYRTPVSESFKYTGTLCARGEDGIHYLYDPYRIIAPLKRAGPRGSGKFKPISWEQLIDEVVNGGIIEETGEKILGIKDLFVYGVLRDAGFDPNTILSEIKSDIDEIKKVAEDKTKTYEDLQKKVQGFKAKWNSKLSAKSLNLEDILIDPNKPDLGTKANQLAYIRGRGQGHADYFYQRWTYAFGSVNWLRHTSSCQLGYYAGNKLWGDYHDVQTDPIGAKVIVMIGAQMGRLHPGATGQGLIIERAVEGDLKLYYVNPTAPRTSARGNIIWVPIKPGTDGAFAMGVLRIMMENNWYNSEYLSYTTYESAKKHGQTSNTNATWIVIAEGDRAGEFLKGKDIGKDSDSPVVHYGGYKLAEEVDQADLIYEGYATVNGKQTKVKTAFSFLRDEAFSRSLEDWSRECSVPVETMYQITKDLYENAPRAGTIVHRGVGMHTHGEYSIFAVRMIDAMLGNYHRKGGLLERASHTNYNHKVYNTDKKGFGEPVRFGIPIDRHKATYEDTLEFWMKKKKGENPYPAKRPYYPLTPEESYTEAFAGMYESYPYPIRALFLYYANPILSANYGVKFIEVLKDPKKLPLFVAITTTINETFLYADYIVPDTTYLETGTMGINYLYATSASVKLAEYWRSPAVMPFTQKVGNCPNGHPRYASMWEFLIDVGLKLGMPGYGEKGIPGVKGSEYEGKWFSHYCVWEYIMRVFANGALDAKSKGLIPEDFDEDSIQFVEQNYPIASFKDLISDKEWKYACYALARGGVFTRYEESFDANGISKRKPKTKTVRLWNEKLAKTRNSLTGEKFYGGPKFYPQETYGPVRGRKGNYGTPLRDLYPESEYPFVVIVPGSPLFTKHRSLFYYWMKQVMPENFAMINPKDAVKLGIQTGDIIRIKTPSGVAEAKAVIEPSIAASVISVPVGMGRWADSVVKKPEYFEVSDSTLRSLIDELPEKAELPKEAVNPVKNLDKVRKRLLFTKSPKAYYESIAPDEWRFNGITPNTVALSDESLRNWPILSWIGAAQVYFFTPAAIEKTGRKGKLEFPCVIW